MVRIDNLKKSYSKKIVFDIPALTLDTGFTCLTGPSGCGKTTLGRVISGLEKSDSGSITGVDGASAVLFQESRLLPSLTAYNNVTAVCRTEEGKLLGRNLLLRLLLTEDDLKKRPSELSGGMARRVSIVRAVVFAYENSGTFALLDEPFTGIDPDTRIIAADILKEHLSDRAVLVITHDGEECELLGGRTLEFSSLLALKNEI